MLALVAGFFLVCYLLALADIARKDAELQEARKLIDEYRGIVRNPEKP